MKQLSKERHSADQLILVGAGKMGGAMLQGWLADGFPAHSVTIVDPGLPEDGRSEFEAKGINVVSDLTGCSQPRFLLLAIKPQILAKAAQGLKDFAERVDLADTTVISIVAGVTIATLRDVFGSAPAIVRAMPNTPALVGAGLTGVYFSGQFSNEMQDDVVDLLSPIGKTLVLETERDIDAITAVSGSGPAYVFHLVEALSKGAEEAGLSKEVAMASAKQTIIGAARLLEQSTTEPAELRQNVTSPNGTTQAGLSVLMDETSGLTQLMERTVDAAFQRAIELGQEQSK